MTSLKHILPIFVLLALPVRAAYQYTEVNEGGYFELNAPSSFDITFLKVTGDGLENVGFYTIADDGSTSAIQQATKTGKNSWSFGEFDAGARVGIWVSSHSGYEFTSSDYFADQGTPSINRDNGDGTFTYDPNGMFEHLADDETATDSFRYTNSDGSGTDVEVKAHAVGSAPDAVGDYLVLCLLYTSPSPRDRTRSRMPSSA